jgi:O-antigen/teichoic acid export membrane protein
LSRADGTARIIRNTFGMVTGRSASMALGFLFWLVADRVFPIRTVGLTAGAVSAMMFCTQVALLGVGSAFITLYPRHVRPHVLVDSALNVVTIASAATAVAALGLFALFFHELSAVSRSGPYAAAFIAMSILGTINILLDQTSIAFGRGEQVLTRNLAFGIVALAGILILWFSVGHATSFQIFGLWVFAGIAACGIGAWQLRIAVGYRYRPSLRMPDGVNLVRVGLPNHVLTLTERLPGFVLPVLTTELLSPAKNAVWYSVWMMAWVAYIIPISAGMALFAELSHDPATLRQAIRVSNRSSLGLSAAAVVALFFIGPPMLELLGHSYAHQGIGPLRVLSLGVIPLTIVETYFGLCRAYGKLREAIIVGITMSVVTIACAAVTGPRWGLTGIAWSWVATIAVVAGVSSLRTRRFMTRVSANTVSGSPSSEPSSGSIVRQGGPRA